MSWITDGLTALQSNIDHVFDFDFFKSARLVFEAQNFHAFEKKQLAYVQIDSEQKLEPFITNYKHHFENLLFIQTTSDFKSKDISSFSHIVVYLDAIMASPPIERFNLFSYLKQHKSDHHVICLFTEDFGSRESNQLFIGSQPIYKVSKSMVSDQLDQVAETMVAAPNSIDNDGDIGGSDLEAIESQLEVLVTELISISTKPLGNETFVSDEYIDSKNLMQHVDGFEKPTPSTLDQPQFQQFSLLSSVHVEMNENEDGVEHSVVIEEESVEYLEYV